MNPLGQALRMKFIHTFYSSSQNHIRNAPSKKKSPSLIVFFFSSLSVQIPMPVPRRVATGPQTIGL
jgi:hypothetical protein